jgi:hypothetical protein
MQPRQAALSAVGKKPGEERDEVLHDCPHCFSLDVDVFPLMDLAKVSLLSRARASVIAASLASGSATVISLNCRQAFRCFGQIALDNRLDNALFRIEMVIQCPFRYLRRGRDSVHGCGLETIFYK